MEERQQFVDLYDIEQRPGAGVGLWGDAVALQLERAEDAARVYVEAVDPQRDKSADGEDHVGKRERRLHADVYFLAMAVRRVLLFHDAVRQMIDDPALTTAREQFIVAARDAKDFRNFYEHLDEYLLGSGTLQKNGRVVGRIAPVVHLRVDSGTVAVRFGDREMDMTAAARAAVALATETGRVWEQQRQRWVAERPPPPDPSDGVLRFLEIDVGVSVVVEDARGPAVVNGTLVDVRVREATPEEVAGHERGEAADDA